MSKLMLAMVFSPVSDTVEVPKARVTVPTESKLDMLRLMLNLSMPVPTKLRITALKLIGAREVGGLLRDAEVGTPTEMTCEFCRTLYRVDVEELRAVLDEIVADRLGAPVN